MAGKPPRFDLAAGKGTGWIHARMLLALPLMAAALFLLLPVRRDSSPSMALPTIASTVDASQGEVRNASIEARTGGVVSVAITTQRDRLLGGLLSPAFDERSCRSRYEAFKYRRSSPFPVSSHLSRRLRAYESQHKKCAPGTQLYADAIRQLNSGSNAGEHPECKYIVWYPVNGVGNRMLSLASTFLYALLTNRVLLVHFPDDSQGLFCEPFPDTSWLLPPDFPIRDVHWRYNKDSPENYVNMLRDNVIGYDVDGGAGKLPPYVYFHLENVAGGEFKYANRSFCDEDHGLIDNFQWLLIKSEGHFAVALFLMPMYERRLRLLFPAKQSVFHHLGRYLFHPTNDVWGIVERYYWGYLAGADERIGIQVRKYPTTTIPVETTAEQILRCAREHQLLPDVVGDDTDSPPADVTAPTTKAVLVVSLKSDYYNRLKARYYSGATASGEVVAVHQPSHEEEQQTLSGTHNQKALAEIYLLSLCDKLVTSYWSTFGYVAHSLAGLRPWILMGPDFGKETASVACVRSPSIEPCLHTRPVMQCTGMSTPADPADMSPHIRHCEDAIAGLKLFG